MFDRTPKLDTSKLPLRETDPDYVEAVARLTKAGRRMDELVAANDRLSADLAEAHREIAFLRKQLTSCERGKNMHMRHSVALHTRMNDALPAMRSLVEYWERALEDARVEAATIVDAPGAAAPHVAVNLDEAQQVVEKAVMPHNWQPKEESK